MNPPELLSFADKFVFITDALFILSQFYKEPITPPTQHFAKILELKTTQLSIYKFQPFYHPITAPTSPLASTETVNVVLRLIIQDYCESEDQAPIVPRELIQVAFIVKVTYEDYNVRLPLLQPITPKQQQTLVLYINYQRQTLLIIILFALEFEYPTRIPEYQILGVLQVQQQSQITQVTYNVELITQLTKPPN
ncbi:Hypothetical_protein [Hexamita inflata]|uniref:Hypothetical_protein n=1 Tax=Hexamita inflata TaxID=28002 RepID=A0AA86UXK3_9EUKA|nr:Hypothetical protein HINF_LOCUS56372 [Hexamita inflata]